jgi:hypothetical protein
MLVGWNRLGDSIMWQPFQHHSNINETIAVTVQEDKFQIIRNKNFQFYDDEVYAPFSVAASERFYKPVKYPTQPMHDGLSAGEGI